MFNQDEGKIECAVGNREICVWQSKKAEIVLILFLTSGFAAFICLWLLVLPNSNNLINHVLLTKIDWRKFKLIWWFPHVFLNTAYKICRWKQKGGQKEDKEVKISKSNIWPIMLEMTYLHMSSFRKPKIFTDIILYEV